MKALVFNHFFDQDITAIEKEKGIHQLQIIPFLYFRWRALSILGEQIINGELEEYNKPEHKNQREKWKIKSREIFEELYAVFKFHIFITPSDTFCYIRDFIDCCRQNHIPVLVLQKETTISPYTLENHSKRVGREFPFISDRMLVCSSRQKQFWLNAGAEEHRITISGQPRFDLYTNPDQVKSWRELGLDINPKRPVILFFSYDLDAYAPTSSSTKQNRIWRQLREETEKSLFSLAESGYQILVKPHPQQRTKDEVQRIKAQMGKHWNRSVFWIHQVADARHLIANADYVVGFQTTGLYEAMLAGKRVIYTHWTTAVKIHQNELIPFWKHAGALTIARSPTELVESIHTNNGSVNAEIMNLRRELTANHLGICDGKAAARAWETCSQLTGERNNSKEDDIQKRNIYRRTVKGTIWMLIFRTGENLSGLISITLKFVQRSTPTTLRRVPPTKAHLKDRCGALARFWEDYVSNLR